MSGRHRPGSARRPALLFGVATLIGVWLGVSAPEVSPVTPPAPAAQVQPAPPGQVLP